MLYVLQENPDLEVEESQIIQDDSHIIQDPNDVQALSDKLVISLLMLQKIGILNCSSVCESGIILAQSLNYG